VILVNKNRIRGTTNIEAVNNLNINRLDDLLLEELNIIVVNLKNGRLDL